MRFHLPSPHPQLQIRPRGPDVALGSFGDLAGDGDIEEPDGKGGCFRSDRWWPRYAGRQYAAENCQPNGMEVPSRYFELWESPETAMLYADVQHPESAAFRETFSLVQSIFNSP